MENKKMTPTITTKANSEKGGKHGEGVAHDDERAALVRPSMMPSFMQRKTVATDEEEKKEKEARLARKKHSAVGPEKKI
jgi:hypothetical protein